MLVDYARTRIQHKVAAVMDRGSDKTQKQLAHELQMPEGTFRSALRILREREAEDNMKEYEATYSWDDIKLTIGNQEFENLRGGGIATSITYERQLIGTYGTGNVGIIGDTHLPYEHRDYLQFCKETFEHHKVDRVIHIGDLIDNHSLSFHDSEPGLRGSRGEYEDARERLDGWYKAFPNLKLIYGNHDAIPARQLKKVGLDPDLYMRPLEKVYEMPPGWSVHQEALIDGVLYHHGHTALGVNGFRKDAQQRMHNTVSGHAHGNAGVSYTATNGRLVYGCAVGCGIDNRSMAFAYGKNFALKPIVSCAVVKDNGRDPHVIAMKMSDVGPQ